MYNSLLFFLLLSVAQFAGRSPAHVVDLTYNQNQTSLGLPGMSSSGSPHGNTQDGKVKLAVTISHIRATYNPDGSLRLELLIYNKGDRSLDLPISQDQRKVHKAGSINRKEIAFSIARQKADDLPSPDSRKAMSVFFSSHSFSDSYLTLAPRSFLRIAISAPAQSVNLHVGDKFFVFAEESYFSDKYFQIVSQSDPVRSEEAATVVERT